MPAKYDFTGKDAPIRSVELELGRIMRRQTGIMDALRDLKGDIARLEKSLNDQMRFLARIEVARRMERGGKT